MKSAFIHICCFVLPLLGFVSCSSPQSKSTSLFKGDLFDDAHLHELRLKFDNDGFWDSLALHKKLKDSLEISKYMKCTVTIDGTELKDVGIRFKGESSYDFTKGKKKSFKLDLNCFIRKQKYQGITRLNLNNNYKDPSLMREKLTFDVYAKEGLPSPKSAYAKVFLNDEYLGLYLLVENIDKHFLKRTFKQSAGNLYFGEPHGTFEKLDDMEKYIRSYRKKNNKKVNNWNDLISLINCINTAQSEEKQVKALQEILELDNCLKTWAINNLLVNVDAYNMMYPHNYYLYADTSTNKLNWINYDFNYSFAAWNPKYTYNQVIDFPIYFVQDKHPFAQLVLKENEILKKMYREHLEKLLESCLNEQFISAKIDQYKNLIGEAVKEDANSEYSYEDFESNLTKTLGDKNDPGAFTPGLLEFVKERKEAVLKQLEQEKVPN